jgi:hypothetical protein
MADEKNVSYDLVGMLKAADLTVNADESAIVELEVREVCRLLGDKGQRSKVQLFFMGLDFRSAIKTV